MYTITRISELQFPKFDSQLSSEKAQKKREQKQIMQNLRGSRYCSIHSLPKGRQENGANCAEFAWLYLTQK